VRRAPAAPVLAACDAAAATVAPVVFGPPEAEAPAEPPAPPVPPALPRGERPPGERPVERARLPRPVLRRWVGVAVGCVLATGAAAAGGTATGSGVLAARLPESAGVEVAPT